jgi:hypothetical protein
MARWGQLESRMSQPEPARRQRVLRANPRGSRSLENEIRFAIIAKPNCRAPRFIFLAFQPEYKAIIGPDFDVVILNKPLGAHHGFTIVSADEGLKLDTPAVLCDFT